MKKLLYLSFILIFFNLQIKSQWLPVGLGTSLGGDIEAILENQNVLFAGGTAYLFRSSDDGNNWNGYFQQFAYAWSLAKSNGAVYCGLAFSQQTPGIYKSTDNGLNWNITSLYNKIIWSIAANDSQIFASADKVYSSTDGGQNWNAISGTLYGHLALSGSRIYCAGSGLRVTNNNGLNWIIIHNSPGIAVLAEDSLIFFGTQDGQIFRSSDYGQSWTESFNKPGAYVRCFYKHNQYVFAGTDSGFFASTDNGMNFINKNDNLNESRISAIMLYNNFLYAANGNYAAVPVSLWKRPLAEVVSVDDVQKQIPSEYFLSQNYPNPFNSYTTINYSVIKSGKVQLVVYDILGRQIAALVNKVQTAGDYSVNFNSNNLSSGVYFYQLTAGDFTQIKKMTLLR